ncbi:recombinase family protein [Candidatus Methylacidithermus pantelleriae]|uniref:Uncharacterized protein n=1 Tax=Candidatus Methylacidithermus pantelleriae TaxID=2744239 RepID=A0A8J2BKU9_9BACT|nr:hypothetical protein [Candidatus Methylacidithermus pantelleriae]CAF0697470.1 hypothetical protein MPNT_220011 [Candidatus Methylacidithermus pantelleriae]
MGFGLEYLEPALATQKSRSILVVDPNGMTDDRVRDLPKGIVSLSARLYEKNS